jgi:hypothetical protein
MGKTTTLRHEKESVRQHCDRIGAQLLWHDLASFGEESRLVRTLFDNEKLHRWRQGTHALYLVLDSFDECHIRIKTLSNLLLEGLRELPTERLFLFIACRPAYWPGHLEKGLKELWGEKGFVATELAPLRERDVREFARAGGVEPEAFLEEVTHRQATLLASRPVTLGFMVGAFKRGKLPVDRWQLYLDGCRYLAQENNVAREESGLLSVLGPGERLTVASRIAALTLLCNRDKIWLGRPDEELPESVLLEQLSGDVEVLEDGQALPMTTEALRETLDSGLFGSRGSRLVGWAHRTYAEFLTALFLKRRDVPREQLFSLLRHPEDTSRRIVPQLYEVAAWLATQDEALRDFLLETDPWGLLQGDAFTMDDELRARLAEAILGTLARGDALSGEDSWLHYHKLAHPGLGAQLRAYLRGSSSLAAERVFVHVLNIAQSCEERSLAPDLADIALDAAQPLNRRTGALRALRGLGDAATKARFLPLALSGEGDDPEGHLRDNALAMLWPEHVPTERIFQFLRERSGQLRGEVGYVWEALDRRLTPAELPMALRWVVDEESQQGRCSFRGSSLQGLLDDLMKKGWKHLLAPGVCGPFCSAVWARLKEDQDILPRPPGEESPTNEWVADGDEKRWHLIEALAASREQPEDLLELEQARPPLFLTRDFHRLLAHARKASSPEEQELWALLTGHLFSFEDPSHLDAVFEAAERSPPIASAFSWLLEPVQLDSPEVERERAQYRQQEREREETQRFIRECEQLLHRIESADIRLWAHLVQHLLPADEEGMDLLGTSPHWHSLPEEMRARIARAAHRFLLDCRPAAEPWLEGGAIPWVSACGYAAFMLLARMTPGLFESLPEPVWTSWASLLLVFPVVPLEDQSDEQRAFRKRVVDLVSEHAPVEVMRSFRRMLAPENQGRASAEFLRDLHGCWNGLLLDLAWYDLKSSGLSLSLFRFLLKVLLFHQHSEARAHAESLLLSTREVSPKLRTVTASVLLVGATESTWKSIWPLLRRDVDFGRRVLDDLAANGGELAIAEGMFTPEQLVDIYIWIELHGGPEAPRQSASPWARPEGIHALKGLIWAVLVKVGSPEACRALERLNRELPGQELLRLLLLRAQEALRLREWQPPSPLELLKLLGSRWARLVGSGTQLLEVLLESLERLQAELHGETPALKFLWNESKAGSEPDYTPKEENDLSDWIKHHLVKDLAGRRIVVNREVEIRATEPARKGQRTDLLVEAIARSPEGWEERVSVIIEVKGCWHRDLWRAMRDQLVERYLAENSCQQGIYLVGWYACDAWDKTTPNPAEGGRPTLERARRILEEQAGELSREGVQVRAFVLDAAFRT